MNPALIVSGLYISLALITGFCVRTYLKFHNRGSHYDQDTDIFLVTLGCMLLWPVAWAYFLVLLPIYSAMTKSSDALIERLRKR